MITFVRRAAIAPGKAVAATVFAKKILDYWKTTYGVELQLLRPIAGDPTRMAWVARYDNLAAFDELSVKSQSDQKYMEMLATGADLFVAGSIHDELWRTA